VSETSEAGMAIERLGVHFIQITLSGSRECGFLREKHFGFSFINYEAYVKENREVVQTMSERRDKLKIVVYNVKNRPLDEIAWCALCSEVKPLFWKNGKLLCYEVRFYPKESKIFVLDSCVADMPNYSKTIRVEGVLSVPPTIIPVVKASPTAEKVLEESLKILKEKAET
jgi:hypothetical protein